MADTETPSTAYATIEDLGKFWRPLAEGDETTRAEYLLDLASDTLRQIALNKNKNLDQMRDSGKIMASTLKLIVMESVKRAMLTPQNQPPVNQMSQTAGPYAESFIFANPAGDLWFKDKELKMLKLTSQGFGSVTTSRTNIYNYEEESL
jgi:hypothetical protein